MPNNRLEIQEAYRELNKAVKTSARHDKREGQENTAVKKINVSFYSSINGVRIVL